MENASARENISIFIMTHRSVHNEVLTYYGMEYF
jgi:hypothetical protein